MRFLLSTWQMEDRIFLYVRSVGCLGFALTFTSGVGASWCCGSRRGSCPRDAQRDGRAFPVLRREKWDGNCPVFRVELKKDSLLQRQGDAHVSTVRDLLHSSPRTGRELGRQASNAKAWSSGRSTLRLWTHSQTTDSSSWAAHLVRGVKFLHIIAAESEQAIEVRLADDLWTPLRLLRTASVERWEILLGASQ